MATNTAMQGQISALKNLVEEANKIPGVYIDLEAETDRQRDALAFIVGKTETQFPCNVMAYDIFLYTVNELHAMVDEYQVPEERKELFRQAYSTKDNLTKEERLQLKQALHLLLLSPEEYTFMRGAAPKRFTRAARSRVERPWHF